MNQRHIWEVWQNNDLVKIPARFIPLELHVFSLFRFHNSRVYQIYPSWSGSIYYILYIYSLTFQLLNHLHVEEQM